MREFLKKAFGKILNGFWILLTAIVVLFVWIPFAGFFCGSIGLAVGFLLSRALSICFRSPIILTVVLVVVGIFHIFPLSYAFVRLKNILFRNWKLRRETTAETKFSFVEMMCEIIPVVFGRLRTPLFFFLGCVVIVSFFHPLEDKSRSKFWDNIDFVSASVASLFVVCGVGYSLFVWKHSPFLNAGIWIERKFGELRTKFKSLFIYYPPEVEKQAHFDAAPVLALIGLFYGLIGGIAVSISLAFIIIYPFWVIGATAFFSLFHLSDLRRMFREKLWLGFFGRIIVLLAISSYVAGFICFSIIGASDLIAIFMIFGVPVGMICGWIWIWLERYFPNNRYLQSFDQIVRGSYKLGVFWKEN